ncbi:acyl-CoA dehydrogenase family protein [Hyunsoonleella sp. 2307UL5-6]|uniref:acyl-CoA dehydrogenase family protein n=1 Tax=Hyunsoonleella sp. 2307UL5-6 TaxID=3384768 RepID=UPI0039BC8522
MNFNPTPNQLELKKKFSFFAKANLNKSIQERDKTCSFSREDWKTCADFGIQAIAVPPQYGGDKRELDLLSSTIAMEGLGYGCLDNGLPFALSAQMWTVQLPIAEFGTELQKSKYLPLLSSGEKIACHALTEPNAGSDVFNMKTSATKVDGGYILNGEKCLITLAPVADIALIFAVTNSKLGKWGISAFIVEIDTLGFSVSTNKEKMGLRTVPIGSLYFKDCFVPEENRLGKEGAGWSITNHSLEHDRCSILASQLGAMEYQLEQSIAYVKKRQQFGTAVGAFQSVSNRIADMKLRLETSRLLLYNVAWIKDQGKSAMLESALLKLQLSESYVASSLDNIRNHGGYGYLSENDIERDLRDAVGGVIYAGTSDIQRNIIAKLLGL